MCPEVGVGPAKEGWAGECLVHGQSLCKERDCIPALLDALHNELPGVLSSEAFIRIVALEET
jgi:hypothetical protein